MSKQRDWNDVFRDDLAADSAVERSLLGKEIGVLVLIALLAVLREMLL